MLSGSFFTTSNLKRTDDTLNATVSFNVAHAIFHGHFPGQPVVPGVCMLQIVKELFEEMQGSKLVTQKADHLKFLAVINPTETPFVDVEISYQHGENSSIAVSGKFFREATTYFKFKINLIPATDLPFVSEATLAT